jgi:cardiolipin synthase (CMP-forming)
MNLPNLLSIFRLFVTIFFILAIQSGRFKLALTLFVIQGISDMLDGFFARIMGQKTNLGALLDPIADKAMLVSAYIVLSIQGMVPTWVTCIVLLRDFVVSFGFLVLYRLRYIVKAAPSFLGKVTTVMQIVTIIYVLWSGRRDYGLYFFYATVLLTVISGSDYVSRGLRILLEKDRAQPGQSL